MKKIINLSGKEYTIKSSAYTQFKYKNDTGRNFLNDLLDIQNNVSGKEESVMIQELDKFLDTLLRLTYVMIEEADKTQVNTYDEFLKSIDSLFSNTDWIGEVIEVGISPLRVEQFDECTWRFDQSYKARIDLGIYEGREAGNKRFSRLFFILWSCLP